MPDDTEALVDKLVAQDPKLPAHERMREALARMQALGLGKQYTEEDLWAAQGRSQFPLQSPPGEGMDRTEAKGMPGVVTPQRQFDPDPAFGYPTATAGPGLQNKEFHPEDPRMKGSASPFGGKALVVGPYELPKKPEKKNKKGKG